MPNLGCPQRCVFCDQSQLADFIKPAQVESAVIAFLAGCRDPFRRQRILAFYGGSFTGIDADLLDAYLDVAQDLVARGIVHGVKASTRPDMLDEGLVARLMAAGFIELELGAQSMDDQVLRRAGRGHLLADIEHGAAIVRSAGLGLGLQIMPGLPGEDEASFGFTLGRLLQFRPDTTRLYPTVVLAGTELERMYLAGAYRPLALDEALDRCLLAYVSSRAAGIDVLRMGLPQSADLKVVAGPYHEAFGFMVRARGYGRLLQLAGEVEGRDIFVNPRDLPELIGYKRRNIEQYKFVCKPDKQVSRGSLRIEGGGENTCLYFRDIIDCDT